ncbi:uncharacterized protein BJ212DRAFT_1361336 [Suillus subaureus]|uniref:Uncharacterized protein n=1 Tax=Suillus subaureus TaxID=48587 RepID=A0A9P7E955_9AGAM|nr:uncharacterized protein BJ212DRAFT_1361336 [Suillus subaureus]KAG1814678.1 hypothetical protein BJ212DRAFT_1361336 [Suillus subaureus]
MTAEERARVDIVEEMEDQKAFRALLAGDMDSAPQIDSVPVSPSEADALRQDVADVATIDNYTRVPILCLELLCSAAWIGWTVEALTSSESAKKMRL